MIIPSIVAKIIYFFNEKNEISNTPKEGFNRIFLKLDNGNSIAVNIFSNDKEMNSLAKYLETKAIKNVKEDKVKTGALDLTYIDQTHPYYAYLEKEINKVKAENPNLTRPQIMKKATYNLSKKIHYKRTLAKKDSIIRLPLAITIDKNGTVNHNARAIIVSKTDDGSKVYSNQGIYMYAGKANHIPIEIMPMFNKENNFVGLFKIETSPLINKEQILYLLEHQIRTINMGLKSGKKPFIMGFNTYYLSIFRNSPHHKEVINIYSILDQIYKRNIKENLPLQEYERYIEYIYKLIQIFSQDKNGILDDSFKASLPLLYDVKDMQSALNNVDSSKGKSPLQTLPDSIINLNFSKENPEIKEKLKNIVYMYLNNIANGFTRVKIMGTLFLPAVNIFGKNEQSWGFLKNNIDPSKFVLSVDNTYELINYLSEQLNNFKNQNQNQNQ